MNMQNLIVYQFNTLYEILKELNQKLNFKIVEAKIGRVAFFDPEIFITPDNRLLPLIISRCIN